MERPAGHPDIPKRKIGVLLVNLGTPDAPTPQAVRRYLGEFLSDRRVVELPAILWQPILRGVVLNTRPRKSAAAYAKVWTERGSPLDYLTEDVKLGLEGGFGPDVLVDHAMRYGRPSLFERLRAMRDAGCERILVAPLYPQYCGATTGTVQDRVFELFGKMRWQPALRTLPPYYDDPAYIGALADSVRAGLASLDFVPELLLTSFHGMPARTLERGDPYHCHCQKTARLLREELGGDAPPMRLTFQSRFGAAEWLKPYTDATLASLPGEGVQRVAVIAPGFAVDCLETLEEIAIQGEETFHAAGGTHYAYLPCLNASSGGIEMMRTLLSRELAGWVSTA
jgi:protoporphyrin/coproporphyrin ferrochelatase